ncbi:MAG: DUF2141 domain-containing protein [Saprospiraceae bacterium]|nr:DUF2141 domain-containing protein [Saprospiraceae bacterium]
MKKLALLGAMLCFQLAGMAQEKGDLTVFIKDKKKRTQGTANIMLFKTADGFPAEPAKAAYRGQIKNVTERTFHTFKDIPYGKYAVAVFLDKNKNWKVDRNLIGMPKEPVGAANMTKLGKPRFTKCQIEIKESDQEVTIKYMN